MNEKEIWMDNLVCDLEPYGNRICWIYYQRDLHQMFWNMWNGGQAKQNVLL